MFAWVCVHAYMGEHTCPRSVAMCTRWWDGVDVYNVHTHIYTWTHIYVDICMFSD